MASFATPADLASYLQVPSVDTYTAQLLLDLASGQIRSVTGQTIDRVTDDAVSLPAPEGNYLTLPQRPASEPTVVEIDGDTVDFTFDSRLGRLYAEGGWRSYGLDGSLFPVSVTYTHGYTTVPSEVKRVCLQAAARAFRNPEGLRSEATGTESYTYATETLAAVDLTDAEIAAVRRAVNVPLVGVARIGF